MKKKLLIPILLLALMIPMFTATAITPINPEITTTYPCTDPLPQPVLGDLGAYETLHVKMTDDGSAADAWITVELYDIDWDDEGDLYVNGFGPIDLPLTGDNGTATFNITIPLGWLVNGVNEFEFKYAMPVPSAGYTVNALELTVKFGSSSELIDWYGPYAGPPSGYIGYDNYLTMNKAYPQNPEWLKLYTFQEVHSNTTIIVQGKDTYGQNIEAKVVIPPGTGPSQYFTFNDTHTTPGMPVAFREITGILQQNGTHCNSFLIETKPDFQRYLGQYMPDGLGVETGFEPNYDLPQGDGTTPIPQNVPVEPANPDPIKIVMGSWNDADGDLFPDDNEIGAAKYDSEIFIEGLDAYGNKLVVSVPIYAGDKTIPVDGLDNCCRSWSTICKVWGGHLGDEYYIFTHPMDQRPLFTYRLRIHHLTIHPDCYDILAYPDEIDGKYPGVTNITIALRDIDGNLLHWGRDGPHLGDYITVNFASTGGKIQPSNDVKIRLCEVTAKANLTADTNPRTVKVTADANVPAIPGKCPAMNLFVWTEITFDGVNSVLYEGELLHAMQWGYETYYYNEASTNVNKYDILTASYTGPVPPKPWLPPELGGPKPEERKLDGPIYEVMIPLYVGCNLISVPIHPMLCSEYATGWPHFGIDMGIPMELLFGYTSAQDCIEAIWWYDANMKSWDNYIPGVTGPGKYFKDGVGYWIKAEKACTIEISGVVMENGPFTPPEYDVYASWNLMGFTSDVPLETDDYLEALRLGDLKLYGPIWTYDAKNGKWTRNPDMLYPAQGFWMNYKNYDDFNNPAISP